jgi:hypothetical protein
MGYGYSHGRLAKTLSIARSPGLAHPAFDCDMGEVIGARTS